MILGIGTDLANIDRIAATLDRFGDRFRNRVFTATEQHKAERRADTPGTYAKRWAAKEACSKALGTGLRMGIAWKDMAVSNLDTGQPVMPAMLAVVVGEQGINTRFAGFLVFEQQVGDAPEGRDHEDPAIGVLGAEEQRVHQLVHAAH